MQTTPPTEPGEGYRLLSVGEIIQADDESYSDGSGPWVVFWDLGSIGGLFIGQAVTSAHYPIRRKVEATLQELWTNEDAEFFKQFLPPTGTEARVCQLIAERQRLGLNKYGVSVQDNPLSLLEWMKHLQAELADALVYVTRAIEEKEK